MAENEARAVEVFVYVDLGIVAGTLVQLVGHLAEGRGKLDVVGHNDGAIAAEGIDEVARVVDGVRLLRSGSERGGASERYCCEDENDFFHNRKFMRLIIVST